MKKILEKLEKCDMIFGGTALAIVVLNLLMPKSGQLVLLDELFDVFIIWIGCAYAAYKLISSKKTATPAQKRGRIIAAIVCVAVGIFFARDITMDLVGGTEKVYLSDVEVSKYQGFAGIVALHYYLTGIDENGDRIRVEISGEDYSNLLHRDSVEIEYYKYTDRVVEFR